MSKENKLEEVVVKDTILGYIDRMVQREEMGDKIYHSTEKNTPRGHKMMPVVVYKDGTTRSSMGWSHFVSLLDSNDKVDTTKTKTRFKRDFPHLAKREVYVTILTSNKTEEKEEKSDFVVDMKPSYDIIVGKSEEMNAKDFKEWLKKYVVSFQTFGYTVKKTKSVSTLLNELKEELK